MTTLNNPLPPINNPLPKHNPTSATSVTILAPPISYGITESSLDALRCLEADYQARMHGLTEAKRSWLAWLRLQRRGERQVYRAKRKALMSQQKKAANG